MRAHEGAAGRAAGERDDLRLVGRGQDILNGLETPAEQVENMRRAADDLLISSRGLALQALGMLEGIEETLEQHPDALPGVTADAYLEWVLARLTAVRPLDPSPYWTDSPERASLLMRLLHANVTEAARFMTDEDAARLDQADQDHIRQLEELRDQRFAEIEAGQAAARDQAPTDHADDGPEGA